MPRYVRITFPVANARYRFSNLNWVIVFDRCNNVPGHAIVGKAASLTGHFCPCTGRVSVICHAGEVSNFKCKLAGRRKGGHRLERKARWAPKYGTNGSIWKGKNEAFFEPIAQRGRGGFLLGLGLKKLQRIRISAK